MMSGEVQHVVESQHSWRNLGEVHSWIHVVLRDEDRQMRGTSTAVFNITTHRVALSPDAVFSVKTCVNS